MLSYHAINEVGAWEIFRTKLLKLQFLGSYLDITDGQICFQYYLNNPEELKSVKVHVVCR